MDQKKFAQIKNEAEKKKKKTTPSLKNKKTKVRVQGLGTKP